MGERDKSDFFRAAGDDVLLGALEWLAEAGQSDPVAAAARPLNLAPSPPPSSPPPSLKEAAAAPRREEAIPKPSAPPAAAKRESGTDPCEDSEVFGESDQGLAARIAAQAQTLDQLREAIAAFDSCPLRDTATHTVFARGGEKVDIMMIGEAPGDEEDKQGKPFVGASGRLLDIMMGQIGLDGDRVRIANILPWRPPGNRTPLPSEIALCLPFLERHIELVRPKILVCLGGVAAKALLGRKEGITVLRRSWHRYDNRRLQKPLPLKPTFHPAYLLRSPGQKRKSWQDLLEIRARLAD